MLNSSIYGESVRTDIDITSKTALCQRRYEFDWEARLLGFVEGSDDLKSRIAKSMMFAKYQARGVTT